MQDPFGVNLEATRVDAQAMRCAAFSALSCARSDVDCTDDGRNIVQDSIRYWSGMIALAWDKSDSARLQCHNHVISRVIHDVTIAIIFRNVKKLSILII